MEGVSSIGFQPVPSGVLWLIVLAPLVAAAAAGLLTLTGRAQRAAPWITVTAGALVGAVALVHRPSRSAGYLGHVDMTWLRIGGDFRIDLAVHLDQLAWVMVGVVCAVSVLVQVYSVGYMRGEQGFARYFAYLSLFTASMLGLVVADNLFQLYVCWELVGICSYLLIGFWWRKPSAASAAKKAFVVTRFGDVGFMLGMLLLAVAAGSFGFGEVEAAFARIGAGAQRASGLVSNEVFLWLVPLLLFCGAVGKSAQFPLHVWLPDAMEGPTPVSALIHAATMVAAGVYMVARLIWLFTWSSVEAPLRGPVAAPLDVVLLVGAATAIIGATIALVQMDIKKVLAYSTISQLGFMMMALGAGGAPGRVTSVFHLVTHAFFKALLFLGAGSVIHALHAARDPNDLRTMGGLMHRMPVTAATCAVGVVALAGLPPFAGFWSKDAIAGLLMERAGWFGRRLLPGGPAHIGPDSWAAWIGALTALAATVLTAFYAVRLWMLAFAGRPRSDEAARAHESPLVMVGPLVVLAAASTAVGWWLHHGGLLAGYLTGESGAEASHVVVMAVATALAATGALVAARLYRRSTVAPDPVERMPRPLYLLFANLWFVDAFWSRSVIPALLRLGTGVAWFDRNIVDGCVRGSGTLVARVGHEMRKMASGQAQSYAAVVVGATVALIVLLVMYEVAASGSTASVGLLHQVGAR